MGGGDTQQVRTQPMRIVSGFRPTGRLHLGHLWGALRNWIRLQDEAQCLFFIADWHALTDGYEKTDGITANTREMLLDWLAAGLDPAKAVIFQQSAVKEHAELYLLFAMIVPTPNSTDVSRKLNSSRPSSLIGTMAE